MPGRTYDGADTYEHGAVKRLSFGSNAGRPFMSYGFCFVRRNYAQSRVGNIKAQL